MRVVVTNWGVVTVSEGEMSDSGARWLKSGKPANLEALILSDFCALLSKTDPHAWSGAKFWQRFR